MKRFFCALLFVAMVSAVALFAEKALTITESGNVGIGTQTPGEKLEVQGGLKVAGRIKDKTGLVMPVGTILPYAGTADNVPEGWLLCDGSAYNGTGTEYEDLFTVIGTGYGDGSRDSNNNPTMGSFNFNVPDLRGLFLRGVSGTTGRDPNRDQRQALKQGGNTGNAAGSYQADTLQGHRHHATTNAIYSTADRDMDEVINGDYWVMVQRLTASVNVGGAVTDPPYGPVRVSTETRPQNVYVNYIIKY